MREGKGGKRLLQDAHYEGIQRETKYSMPFKKKKKKKVKQWTRKGQSALCGWQSFMALVLQQIYLDDVSGSNPAFSLVAFTTCLLKPPLCYRAADHNQNSLCEIEFTSGHTGLAR